MTPQEYEQSSKRFIIWLSVGIAIFCIILAYKDTQRARCKREGGAYIRGIFSHQCVHVTAEPGP